MKLGLRQILATIPALFLAMLAAAQELPVMPSDPAVSSGVLPNGMSYYIASDSSEKGLADFALIQKTGSENVQDSTVAHGYAGIVARDALSSLPRLRSSSSQAFFRRHGSVPGKDGYVSVSKDATIYRFPNVRLSDGKAVLDSALMVLLDISDRGGFTDDEYRRQWYAPADQAVVVAGDVDAKAVLARLEAMSYMLPSASSRDRIDVYVPDSSGVRVADIGVGEQLREITMDWVSKRVPREYMRTVQPVIFDMVLDVLGKVLERRMRAALETEDIAAADVSCFHRRSDEGLWDDVFTLSVSVHPEQEAVTRKLMTGVVGSIDSDGIGLTEFLHAEADFMDECKRKTYPGMIGKEYYVQRCISAFLYDSYLSSPAQILAFHTSRQVEDSVRCRLFNNVAAALISPLDDEGIPFVFNPLPVVSDLDLPEPGVKVKIKSTKKDHLSGGSVWTFSNGFKVVYRHMPSSKDVYYTLALNGGYSSIHGLGAGEGAFVSDVFRLSRIAGVKGEDFFNALRKEGVVMDPVVTMSNILVEGHLPKDRIELLLQSLLALADTRSDMKEAFPYYRKSEEAALEHPKLFHAARMTAIDSIMCPGYRYSPYKSKGALTSSFLTKASAFVDEQMKKMNDGLLVIVGNIDEDSLKQTLMQYVGGFRVSDIPAKRPVIRYQPVSGWSTYTVKGTGDAVDVALSARMPLTSVNYLSACIAVMALERDLTEALADSGVTFEVMFNCRIYPEERVNVLISVYGADPQGFAWGMEEKSPIDVLSEVRTALSGLALREISDDQFKQYKAYLKNHMDVQMNDPLYWVDAITVRHLDGKDLTTRYATNIDALSKNDVKKILSLIDKGCKIEYVTTR